MNNESFKSKDSNLKFDFVGMMFALAVGQIGYDVSDLIRYKINVIDYSYLLVFLVLVTFIIASSWIGWQNSTAKGNKEIIEHVFSRSFIALFIDLFLVICYFVLASLPEVDNNGKISFNLKFEVWIILLIFLGYFIWDIITKMCSITDDLKIEWDVKKCVRRSYQSCICLVFSTGVLFVYKVLGNLLCQCIFLALFILFRGLKIDGIFKMKTKKLTLIFLFNVFLTIVFIFVIASILCREYI